MCKGFPGLRTSVLMSCSKAAELGSLCKSQPITKAICFLLSAALFLCQTLLFVFEALECFSDVVSANEIARLLHDVERLSLANKVKPVSVVELRIAKDKFLRLVVD